MSFILDATKIILPETDNNQFEGINTGLIPLHSEFMVEKTVMEEVGRGRWAPVKIQEEYNGVPIINIDKDGHTTTNFRAAVGAHPDDLQDARWVKEQAVYARDVVNNDIALDDIIDSIVFIDFYEEEGEIWFFLNRDDYDDAENEYPEKFAYKPDEGGSVSICSALKSKGFIFVAQGEDVGCDSYLSVVNPDHLTGICYFENNTHAFELTKHENAFLGCLNTRDELINMMGEEDYYALAYFHAWETHKPVPLKGLSEEYLNGSFVDKDGGPE